MAMLKMNPALRVLLKVSIWVFLLTLPFTALPVLLGIRNAVMFQFWYSQQVQENSDKWLYAIKDLVDSAFIPDLENYNNLMDNLNDFHILRINTLDWVSKLGFLLPLQYDVDEYPDTPIDMTASLDTLMYDTSQQPTIPIDQWVYLTDLAWPEMNPWDAAFDSVLQIAYVHPLLNQSRFFFGHCVLTADFLCGVWGIKHATLLHFHIEDNPPVLEDIAPDLSYQAPFEILRPVTVRSIAFPLEDAFLGFPSPNFPSEREQMLAVMAKEDNYEQFQPYSITDKYFSPRYFEYMESIWDNKESPLRLFHEAIRWMDDHVYEPLGLTTYRQDLTNMAYSITAAITLWWLNTASFVVDTVKDFLGYPLRGDWIVGDVEGMVEDMTSLASQCKSAQEVDMNELLLSLQNRFPQMSATGSAPGGTITGMAQPS